MSQTFDAKDQLNPADAFAVPGGGWDLGPDAPAPAPPPAMDNADAVPGTVFGSGASSVEQLPPLSAPPATHLPPMGSSAYVSAPQNPMGEPYADPDETLAAVPRITIAAFCERPETAQMIEQTGNDRRLSRAHISVSMGGLPAAIEHYLDEGTPNLILIESGMRGRGLFAQLDELANVCDAGTKVVVIGAANDISLYRELIRRGISEYLVPPLVPMQMVRTISGLFADPDKPFVGKVTAFIGAKGGVGSSTLAHNLAWQIAESCRVDTSILDLDLSFGTAGLDFNQDSPQGIGDALAEPDRVDDVLLERLMINCTERLSLFTAPATLEREWELSAASYETVISEVRSTVPHIILDLPHTWTTWVKNTLLLADEVIIVASPDLACLRNAKNLYDLLRSRRANDFPPKIIVNQVGVPKRPEISVKDFAEALGAEPTLVLPFEPELFGQATNNGQMLSEVNGASKAVSGIQSLATLLSGKEVQSVKKQSLISKLLRRG
ncbi:MAG: pilus assembly protein CpaE [Robiginitomaculum sp.]|nr:MAG: pilus assembly protein CpaE [Robiginitomaculum sp.]